MLECGKFDRDGGDKMSIISIVSSMISLPHLICWVPRFGLLRSDLEAIGCSHQEGMCEGAAQDDQDDQTLRSVSRRRSHRRSPEDVPYL